MTKSCDAVHVNSNQPSVPETNRVDDRSPVVLECTVRTEDFILAQPLQEFPTISIEFERAVPTTHNPLPYLWVTGAKNSQFEKAIAAAPCTDNLRTVATFERGVLYGIRWNIDVNELFARCANSHPDTVLLQAHAQTDEWWLKFRFPSRRLIHRFHSFYQAKDIDLRIIRMYALKNPKLAKYDLTQKQYEALRRAFEEGYFEIPRQITLQELANDFDISQKALSERLRRGLNNIVWNAIAATFPHGMGVELE